MQTVHDLMSTSVRSVRDTEVIGPVRDLMLDGHVHSVLVLDGDDRLVGVLTSTDLVEEWPPQLGVQTVMSRDPITVAGHTTVADAARIMLDRHIHHLVVLGPHGVDGVVSSFDLLRNLASRVEALTGEAPQPTSVVTASVGDVIVVRPRLVGGHERRATIVEVHGADGAPPYTVRWSDDQHDRPHLTLFFPGSDTYVEHPAVR
jgi:CBS-domain-containing membrane protein